MHLGIAPSQVSFCDIQKHKLSPKLSRSSCPRKVFLTSSFSAHHTNKTRPRQQEPNLIHQTNCTSIFAHLSRQTLQQSWLLPNILPLKGKLVRRSNRQNLVHRNSPPGSTKCCTMPKKMTSPTLSPGTAMGHLLESIIHWCSQTRYCLHISIRPNTSRFNANSTIGVL